MYFLFAVWGGPREEGVHEALARGVLLARPAPDRDEEVHRNQADLPEDEELEQVERQEYAVDRRLHEQEHREERGHAVVLVPSNRKGERREERVQEDEDHGELVRPEDVVHAQGRDPRALLDGEVGMVPHRRHRRKRNHVRPEESREEDGGQAEDDEGERERDGLCGAVRSCNEREDPPDRGQAYVVREEREIDHSLESSIPA